MVKSYLTTGPSQTKKLGEVLAKKIIRSNLLSNSLKFAIILGLTGELGGGKTTFLQGFAKGLRIKEKILSPTFIIMRKYRLTTNDQRPTIKSRKSKVVSRKLKSYFYHIDCYRIKKPEEILTLGFKKIISDPRNIVVIEWAEKLRKILPKNTIWIQFNFINKNTRQIIINPLFVPSNSSHGLK